MASAEAFEDAVRPVLFPEEAARLLVPGPEVDGHQLAGFTGRWLVRHGLILTAIAVPA